MVAKINIKGVAERAFLFSQSEDFNGKESDSDDMFCFMANQKFLPRIVIFDLKQIKKALITFDIKTYSQKSRSKKYPIPHF